MILLFLVAFVDDFFWPAVPPLARRLVAKTQGRHFYFCLSSHDDETFKIKITNHRADPNFEIVQHFCTMALSPTSCENSI